MRDFVRDIDSGLYVPRRLRRDLVSRGVCDFMAGPGFHAGGQGPDPHASSVTLKLDGQGANGSTTIVDTSPSARTVTVFGNAQISTAQKRYGVSSLKFDGTGDYLRVAHSTAFSLRPSGSAQRLTIEGFIFPQAFNASGVSLITKRPSTFPSTGWSVLLNDLGVLRFLAWNAAGTLTVDLTSTESCKLNAWNHFEVCQDLTPTWYMFLGGKLEASGAETSGNVSSNTQPLHIGTDPTVTTRDLQGYLHLRVTTGVTRHTTDFIPPISF